MAVPTGQRARRLRSQSEQFSLRLNRLALLRRASSLSCSSSLSWLRRLRSTWYWAIWQYGRIVSTRYGSIDATTATQLLINTTRFSLPRDIGTPRQPRVDAPRCTGTLEPRDIGTPSAQGGERAPTREPAKGTAPRNGIKSFRYPLGRRRRFLRCVVHGQAAHGGYDVLGWCMLLAGAVFGLFFPRLKGEARSEDSCGVRRPLFKSCHPLGQEVPGPPLWVDSPATASRPPLWVDSPGGV